MSELNTERLDALIERAGYIQKKMQAGNPGGKYQEVIFISACVLAAADWISEDLETKEVTVE